MQSSLLERARSYLLQKRVGLDVWLRTSPADKKALLLGTASEEAVVAHLATVEEYLVKAESGALGICTVCHDQVEPALLEIDYTSSICLDHLSNEEARRLEDELELAQTVQKALLPQEAPSFAGLEIAAYSRPAHFVGGDYFDFIDFSTDTHGLVIADVAGHGVSASLQMAGLQALARALVPICQSPAEVAGRIHTLFVHNIRFTTFVTMFIGSFSPESRKLTYCNAGHNPPFVIRQRPTGDNAVCWLEPTGAAIGLVEELAFSEKALDLDSGDLLVMYTDGVVEARGPDGSDFGVERLVDTVKRLRERSPSEVIRGVKESFEEFVGDRPISDDTTFLVCRVR